MSANNHYLSDLTPLTSLLESGRFPFLNKLVASILQSADTIITSKSYISNKKLEYYKADIRNIHDTIIRNIQNEIPSLEQISSTLNMKPGTFSLIFKEIYKKPYYTYFLDFKLGVARDLLLTGQYSVQTVSHLLGYSHPIKLIIPFKKRFSVTPGAIKKSSKITKK